ncbi:MAG TPA: hypothetical protein PKD18_05220 [Saprospiraceae bacterium]|nr:hypothetical protein [Saprospiraceae bacterium]
MNNNDCEIMDPVPMPGVVTFLYRPKSNQKTSRYKKLVSGFWIAFKPHGHYSPCLCPELLDQFCIGPFLFADFFKGALKGVNINSNNWVWLCHVHYLMTITNE